MNYAEEIGQLLIAKNLKISTAESCTGGLLSSYLTDVSGSSNYITLNLVTYSNAMKHKMLNVPDEILETKGAVSSECAFEMAKGLYELTSSDICVSTTGIAGPTGGTKDKPVGLMYSAIYTPDNYQIYKIIKPSETPRTKMKELFVEETLKNIYEFINNNF